MTGLSRVLRRCPSCKSWFSIQRASREPVDSRDDSDTILHEDAVRLPSTGGRAGLSNKVTTVTTFEREEILVEDFLDTYRCKKCNYTWKEPYHVEEKVQSQTSADFRRGAQED